MISAESGEAWAMLQLAIELHDFFRTDAALSHVRSALEIFATSSFSEIDVREACSALESASANLLPMHEMEAVREIVTKKAGDLLTTLDPAIPLDDVNALDIALHRFGSDPNFADQASLGSLAGIAQHIDDHLREISSVDDLEAFDYELEQLMKRHNFKDTGLMQSIAEKRNELYIDDAVRAGENYTNTSMAGAATDSEMTTDEIRSMFKEIHRE
jgi:hypothetical protein